MDALHALIGSEDAAISWWQMTLRGLLIFSVGVLAARVAASRAFGKWSPLDIIFAVIVGSNLGRAMTGSAPFVATIVATLALVAVHTALARAAARWSWLSFLVKGGRVRLVKDGDVDRAAMRRSGIGDGDLAMALRTHGHTGLDRVRRAYLERNGDITLLLDAALIRLSIAEEFGAPPRPAALDSVSREKLRKVLMRMTSPNDPTVSRVSGAVMVLMMSAPTSSSRPSRIPRPRLAR